MASEKLLVKTKDNCVMVFDITYTNNAEKIRLKHECENIAKNIIYNSSQQTNYTHSVNISPDEQNTRFLNEEISGYHYRKDRDGFSNGMQNDSPLQPDTLYLPHQMSDDEFPEMIKNLGFKIMPNDKEYTVRYNSANAEFVTTPDFVKTNASVNSSRRYMLITRNHFHFSPHDYRLLEDLKQRYMQVCQSQNNITEADFAASLSDAKERDLFYFYTNEVVRNRYRNVTINHELKHIINSVFYDGLTLKQDYKRLQVEDYYRVAMEDERSAYLGELVKNINEYLQNGNFDDFSMFNSNNDDFVCELKRLSTAEERRNYVTDWPNLVSAKMRDFEQNFREHYDEGQIPQNLNEYIKRAPLAAAEDIDHREFKRIRSLFYTFQIYNPSTHRTEQVNLARYITPDLEIEIDADKQNRIINPAKANLQNRLNDFTNRCQNGEIDVSLIEPAKKLMRDSLNSSEFVSQIDNFRISQLYEPESNLPELDNIPNDHADWSNGLQNYWQQTEGYRELAKNNLEYKFQINEATVRYTSQKDVEISSNADYALYDKLLKEPTGRSAPVEFLETLSNEQKLLLYIACVNNGRRMTGQIPTDLSGINNLQGVPMAALNMFNHRQQSAVMQRSPATSVRSSQTVLKLGMNPKKLFTYRAR